MGLVAELRTEETMWEHDDRKIEVVQSKGEKNGPKKTNRRFTEMIWRSARKKMFCIVRW